MTDAIAAAGTSAANVSIAAQKDGLTKVARQFEAVFLRQMIGSMRQATLAEGALDSSASDQFRDMQDSSMADSMADAGGFGVAQMLLKQFDAHPALAAGLDAGLPAAATPVVTPAGAAAMSDLLGIGTSGISAYSKALSTVAQNTANVDTPGYVRRQANLTEIGIGTTPSGVQAAAITRVWDDFKAADARLSASDASRAATRTQWLSAAETALPDGDQGVGAKLTAFFNAGTALAADPDGTVPRQTLLTTLDQAATGLRTAAEGLARVSQGIGDEASATARGINDDLASLAAVNLALTRAASGSGAAASLTDERDRLLDGLSDRIGIETSFDAKGAATVSLTGNGGTPLLKDGDISLIAVEQSADGRLALWVQGDSAVAVVPTGGSMAGLVDAASQVAGSRATLDAVAVDLAAKVNGWNAAGLTATGAAGAPLLSGTSAATLAMIAGLAPAAIAARGIDGSLNGNAVALSALRTGDGPEARIETLIGTNAQALAASRTEAAATATRSDTAFAARDATSAVDLDREASDLLRYQQAYNGSAKVLQVARDTLNTILQLF